MHRGTGKTLLSLSFFRSHYWPAGEEANGPDVGLHNKKKLQQRGKGSRKSNKQNRWK